MLHGSTLRIDYRRNGTVVYAASTLHATRFTLHASRYTLHLPFLQVATPSTTVFIIVLNEASSIHRSVFPAPIRNRPSLHQYESPPLRTDVSVG